MKLKLTLLFTFLATSLLAQRAPVVYNTMAEMKASTTLNSVSTNIVLLGYYRAGDGGGNNFVYDKTSTAATNLGTIIKPTSLAGRLLAVIKDSTVNARQFGAKGDAVTDDTLAIQDMLNWRDPVSGRPGIMRIPAGYYRWSTVTGSGGHLVADGRVEYGADVVAGSTVVCEQLLGATNHFILVNNPSVPAFPGKPSMTLENLLLIGHPEANLRDAHTITAVYAGDRLHFSVAAPPTLTSPKGGVPYFGFGALFTDDNQYLGAFCLQNFVTNGVTTNVTTVRVAAGTDAYATVAGEDILRVGFKVCFPAMKQFYYQNSPYTLQPSSANAGYAALELNDAGIVQIKNCYAINWHAGIVCASESIEVDGFLSYNCHYSGLVAEPFGGTFADGYFHGAVQLNGKYQRDDALAVGTHTLKNIIYQSSAIGMAAWGAQTHADRIVAGPTAMYGVFMYGVTHCTINDLLIESPALYPLFIPTGNPAFPQGPNSIARMRVLSGYSTFEIPDNRSATIPIIEIAGTEAKITVASLSVAPFVRDPPSTSWRWYAVWYWPSYLLNDGLVGIGQFSDEFGMVSRQEYSGGLLQRWAIPGTAVMSGGMGGVNPVAIFERPDTGAQYGWTISNGLRLAFASDTDGSGATATANIVGGAITSYTVNTGGSGYVNNQAKVTITGDGTGARAIPVLSGGVVTGITVIARGEDYTTATVTISPVPQVNDVGLTFNRTTAISTIGIGDGNGSAAPIIGILQGEYALSTSTNLAGGTVQIRPGLGRGTASTSRVQLSRSVPTTSGAGAQTHAVSLEVLSDGSIYYDPLAIDPDTGSAGSVFANSTDDALKLRQGGAWRWIQTGFGNYPNRQGMVTLNAETNVTAAAVTITIASPAVVSFTGHGMIAQQPLIFSSTEFLPTGLYPGRTYYVSPTGLTADAFQLLDVKSGTTINTSGTQSGVHTCFPRSAAYTTSPSNWHNVIVLNVPITADRTVTLGGSGALLGQVFKFTRTVASTGAFNWKIDALKDLAPGTWCEIEWDGAAYILTQYGSL